ncbi:MAG: DUF2330 domain-containing protein, partial [Candidatus Wallbacteria bacterium]|nr:DUF2330 domain-containing protein [Candidatus Wallbacteria bacterium]
MIWRSWMVFGLAVTLGAGQALGACCYFAAQDRDVNQPGQKAFLTWEPKEQKESLTVQPAFEGDARDFGMVIPSPAQPKLDEMPRDFFRWLAVYTILLPMPQRIQPMFMVANSIDEMESGAGPALAVRASAPAPLGVTVLESGVVGSLDYKIIKAEDANGLFEWLKQNQYKYAGDEQTLDHYIKKKWFFTVMKIDTKQMKKNPDGSYKGEVTPTRFAFKSDSLVYPLKIT